MNSMNDLAHEIHIIAEQHGWWEPPHREFGELIMLCVCELSEAVEEFRDHRGVNEIYYRESDGKPEGIPMELADTIIRILDLCGHYGINIEEVIKVKVEFNKSRPYKHGGKKI